MNSPVLQAEHGFFPTPSRGERIVDQLIHVVGIVGGGVAVSILIALAGAQASAVAVTAVAVYGAGLLAMLGCSALYHASAPSRFKEIARRLDHAAIYVMI